MKTKQRIIETARQMFNRRGVPNVSTNHIAEQLEISPGNLYYHYKSREEIVDHLFNDYQAAVEPLMADVSSSIADIDDFWLYIHLVFELTSKYSFIYRDSGYLIDQGNEVSGRLNRIFSDFEQQIQRVVSHLSELEIISIDPRLIKHLASSVLITCSQWIGYQKLLCGNQHDPASVERLMEGAYQVMTLLTPYLEGENREYFEYLSSAYLNP
jgi:AcrR family transcriptional regulator